MEHMSKVVIQRTEEQKNNLIYKSKQRLCSFGPPLNLLVSMERIEVSERTWAQRDLSVYPNICFFNFSHQMVND